MSERIVVGVDGSQESSAAVDWAGREAVARGASVYVLNVWRPPASNVQFSPDPEAWREWEEGYAQEAAVRLTERHPGLDVTAAQLSGTPVKELVAAADDADLLVLGSRGIGVMGRFLLGSVTAAALGRCRRPVVLVRGEQPDTPAERGTDIVVGMDLRRGVDPLMEVAVREATAHDALVRVVHVFDPHREYGYGAPALDTDIARQIRAEAAADVERWTAPWRRSGEVRIEVEVPSGPVAATLLQKTRGAGLLVVGRGHHSVAGRLGPVTQAVVHHATCPIAVTHGA